MSYANSKGTVQPAHQPSLNSAFVIHCINSIILTGFISEVPRLLLASEAEQPGLSLTGSSEDKLLET